MAADLNLGLLDLVFRVHEDRRGSWVSMRAWKSALKNVGAYIYTYKYRWWRMVRLVVGGSGDFEEGGGENIGSDQWFFDTR